MRRLPLVLAAALLSFAPAAHADDADDFIARGIELREQAKDDEALVLFKRALAVAPSPRARAQVGLAEQALGLWLSAESDLAAALAEGSDPWIAKNRTALDGALATTKKHLGALEVRGDDGTDVLLDGVVLGHLPHGPFRVEAGRRLLELRAKGFQSTTRFVEIPAVGVARETVRLARTPEIEGPGARPQPARESAPTDPGRGQRVLGWSFVGAGGAFVLGGVAALVIRSGIIAGYNDRCPGVGAGNQPGDCADEIESSRTWQTISIVSMVAGGAFAVGGVALVLTAPRPHAGNAEQMRSHGSAWRCVPSPFGVGCAGQFAFF